MPQSLTYRFGLCGCDMDKICIEKKKKKSTCHLYIQSSMLKHWTRASLLHALSTT